MQISQPAGQSLQRQLRGYRLTTAEILYRMPDHPALLQSYVWQNLDIAPKFPELQRFLEFWTAEIEGKLYSVRVAAIDIVSAGEWRGVAQEFRLH